MVFEGFAKGLSFAITGDITGLVKAVGQAELELAKVDKAFSTGEKAIEKFGTKMTSLGKNMSMSVTAPIIAVGTASVYVAAEFDDSMRQVQATSGATGAEFGALREQARQLGADTAFSATEAAEGMNYLAAAGFDANQVMAAMPGMLSLASAGSVELGEAASIASSILNGFGLEAEEAGRVADVLAKSAAATNAGVTDMGEAMSYVAPVAKSTGLSLEEVAAAVGVLSNAGIQGSMAGTSLRGIISGLLTPTDKAADVLDRLGITVKDSAGEMLPLNEIIAQFEKSGLTAADALTIFGDRAGPGMLALVQQGSSGLVDLTAELKNSEGAATAMANTMESGPGGAFRTLEGSMEDLAITFGDALIPAILPFIDLLKDLANWLSSLDKNTLTIIVTVAAFAAAVGPVLIVLGMLISSIGTIMTILPALGGALTLLAAHPIILVLVVVIASLVLLEAKFGLVSKAVAFLSSEFDGACKLIGDFVGWVTTAVDWSGLLYTAFMLLLGPIGWIQLAMDALGVSWSDVFTGIVDTFKWAFNIVIDGFNTMINGLNTLSFGVPDWVPLIGGQTIGFDLPTIPRLAAGGTITSPGDVIVGDAGPEILTLPTGATVTPLSGNGGTGVTITGNTFVIREDADIPKLARELGTYITSEMRRKA